jgi:hypothetical protein
MSLADSMDADGNDNHADLMEAYLGTEKYTIWI